MMKEEFESLAMRGNGTISGLLYNTVERYYMSDNRYHNQFGGRDESKQDFVKRVFGGKVNTPKTILKKMIAESIKETRWCLQGNESATKDRLDNMDRLIANKITWEAGRNYI